MARRYTIKELKEWTDMELLRHIVRDRVGTCTNPYSPLSQRLEELRKNLDRRIEQMADQQIEISGLKIILDKVYHILYWNEYNECFDRDKEWDSETVGVIATVMREYKQVPEKGHNGDK
jgi:hypothetical protein